MKHGKPLTRHTPLSSQTELKSKAGLQRGVGPRRKKALRSRSKKTEGRYVLRRALVDDLLAERPWCEIRWDEGCTGRAVDVDEVLSRGRGGDYLDPENCQTTCRYCHDKKHTEPAEALDRGVAAASRGRRAA